MHQDFVEKTQIVYFAFWKDKDCTLIGNARIFTLDWKCVYSFIEKNLDMFIKCAQCVSDMTFIGYGEVKQKSDVQVIYYGLVKETTLPWECTNQPKIYFG